MERKDRTNFIMSLALIKHLDAIRGSYIVADVLLTHMTELYSDGYHFFDVSVCGKILAHRGRHINEVTVGKWARSILMDNHIQGMRCNSMWDNYGIMEADLEKFQNHIKGRVQLHTYSFEVIGSNHIPDIMVIDRENTGRLGDSCMNNKPHCYRMLKDCPDLSCVILTDSKGTLIARSFLWNVEVGGGVIKFMDRFYTCRDYLDGVLMDYARDNGYWRKYRYDTYEQPQRWVSPEMKIVNVVGTVPIKGGQFKQFPFLDTFCYGGEDYLSNSSKGCKYLYQSVFGGRVEQRQLTGEECAERQLLLNTVNNNTIDWAAKVF